MTRERDALKEAVLSIEAGVSLLLEAGHPNVPSLLRRFAKDVEKLGRDPPPDPAPDQQPEPPPPSARIIRLSDWLPIDDTAQS